MSIKGIGKILRSLNLHSLNSFTQSLNHHSPFLVTLTLKAHILDALRRSGSMTFERYMELCLYHPQLGYYMQGRERTGVAGDYFTSSDLHAIFARLVARQAMEMWETLGRPCPFDFVECGPGRGLFASEFLIWAKQTLPDFFVALAYTAIDPAGAGALRRARVLERLQEKDLGSTVRLSRDLEELNPITGCFFSNELVDAFPVSVVTRAGGHLKEIYVTVEDGELLEKLGPLSDPALAAYVARYAPELEEGQRAEINLHALRWIRSVAGRLARGFVLTIDYGDVAERLYMPERRGGTLLAYRAHQASEDFFSAPGECDLTAHVNFSALIDAGKDAGLEFTGFTTQEGFLMALGEPNEFGDLYDAGQDEVRKLQARLKLKRLISPAGMGTTFKVLIQHRGVLQPKLAGLRYARRNSEL
jgi:SAM-dependent MidA family methyltransferase